MTTGGVTADDVKEALRRRHPAEQFIGSKKVPGAWTTIEEWLGIDLLAVSAHASPSSGAVSGVRYPRVGYEVKVSRADYRREVLRPEKRTLAVSWCNAFFFAVPAGLLTAEEVAYVEPEWEPGDFNRAPCAASPGVVGAPGYRDDPGPCFKGRRETRFVGPLTRGAYFRPNVSVVCDRCGGRGYAEPSRVERDAPTLWIPRDVGLIAIDGRGCRIVRPSPIRKDVAAVFDPGHIAKLIRWVSARPDPRHLALGAREAAAA